MAVGAAACALVAMVGRICASRPKYEPKRALTDRIVNQADRMRKEFLSRKERDERAFDAVVAAKGDMDAMQRALHDAAAVPLEGARASLDVLALTVDALELNNANLISDLGCAAEFAHAALCACTYNVRINHKYMDDAATVSAQRTAIEQLRREAGELLDRVRSSLGELAR